MAERDASPRLTVEGNRIAVSGALGFASVMDVLDDGRRALAAIDGQRAVLDLGAVTSADSAGLALVVDWLRAARARGVELELHGVPAQLAAIARVSELESLVAEDARDAA